MQTFCHNTALKVLVIFVALIHENVALMPNPSLRALGGVTSRVAALKWSNNRCRDDGTRFHLSKIRLQEDPFNSGKVDSNSDDVLRTLQESANDVFKEFNSRPVPSINFSLLLPLLSIPLWMGLIGFGLFMPSPESLLENLGATQAAYSAPWDILPASAKDVVTAIPVNPFGTSQGGINLQDLANPQLDPNLFVPVCKFSDTFYRGAKNSVLALAGKEVYQEYAPLIAGSLLRVRLEFCVLESFVYESILPFIKARGLSWVFPIRETLETFVAGVVFAVASNVVLIGSTKIISIAIFYSDFFIGLPIRLTFGFINDRLIKNGATKNPLGLVLVAGTGAIRLVGQFTEVLRKFIEVWDVFVGRYLLLSTFGYVVLKFLKFKGVLTIEKLGALWNTLISTSDSVPM